MAMADSSITQVSQEDTGSNMISSSSSSPITQVVPPAPPPTAAQYYVPDKQFYPSKFVLDLRGTRFDLDRETLIALPESILVVMFPNGLILRPKSSGGGGTTSVASATANATTTGTGGGGSVGRGVGGAAVTTGQLKGKASVGTGLASALGRGDSGSSASTSAAATNNGFTSGHGHHPSESTYTDYSDYSDYSYDYDDDDDEGHGLDREELLDDEDLTDDDEEEEEQVIVVDFDPVCLQYILDNYRQAQRAGEIERRIRRQEQERQLQLQLQQQQHLLQQLQLQQQQGSTASKVPQQTATTSGGGRSADAALPTSPSDSSTSSGYHQPLPLSMMVPQNPLLNKQAIIVLREELDYFVIPPSTANRLPTNSTNPSVVKSPLTSKMSASTSTSISPSRPLAQIANRDSADGPLPLLGATPTTATSSSSAKVNATENGCVNSKASGDMTPNQPPKMIKTQCGQILLQDRKIFAALQRNIDKEKNQAEQQLMDMLCVSGFQKEGEWGYRRVEPKRTTVVSVAMVMLRTSTLPYSATATTTTTTATAIPTPSTSSAPAIPSSTTTEPPSMPEVSRETRAAPPSGDEINHTTVPQEQNQGLQQEQQQQKQQQKQQQQEQEERNREQREQEQKQIRNQQQQLLQQQQFQMAIAEKLLLFWRKPARKCWWDGIQVEVHQDPSDITTNTPLVPVRLWARRTWTLELVLV
ncbi:hypothetical protein FBU30_008821 [Linnemannia zychae]|nr:hypothetical protein FBU30_008821 [Linnemannia zychae]